MFVYVCVYVYMYLRAMFVFEINETMYQSRTNEFVTHCKYDET